MRERFPVDGSRPHDTGRVDAVLFAAGRWAQHAGRPPARPHGGRPERNGGDRGGPRKELPVRGGRENVPVGLAPEADRPMHRHAAHPQSSADHGLLRQKPVEDYGKRPPPAG